jgi:hypothetical protein
MTFSLLNQLGLRSNKLFVALNLKAVKQSISYLRQLHI